MKSKSSSIWTQSPCTLAFSQHHVVLQKADRFSFQSIYHKQKLRPKLKFKSELIRPESCLIEFRRQIQQSHKPIRKHSYHHKSTHVIRKSQQLQPIPVKNSSSQFQQEIIGRLAPTQPIQLDKIYDRNGMRSTFYESDGQQKIRYSFKKSRSFQSLLQRRIKGPKVYVSGSARIDLSKPQNFNPGPGSYFLDKRDNQEISQLYQRAHKSSSKKTNHQIQTHDTLFLEQNKQNSKFMQGIFAKEKKRQKKSRLGRVSTAIKSKTQFTFFNGS